MIVDKDVDNLQSDFSQVQTPEHVSSAQGWVNVNYQLKVEEASAAVNR